MFTCDKIFCRNKWLSNHREQFFISPIHNIHRITTTCSTFEVYFMFFSLSQIHLTTRLQELLSVPEFNSSFKIFSYVIGCCSIKLAFIKFAEFGWLILLSLFTGIEKWFCICNVLQINTFNVGPLEIFANRLPWVLLNELFNWFWGFISKESIAFCFDIISYSRSLRLNFCTITRIKGEHVIIWPSVHLNREDSSLKWQSFSSHFINPWLKVKAFYWRHSIILLFFLYLIIIFSWRIHA